MINLHQKNLGVLFSLSLFFTLTIPVLYPPLRLLFFAPYLVVLYYNKSLVKSLWSSIGCGLILDLLSSQHYLGLHAISFTVTTLLLYGQKKHFFADSLSTLPLMTYFFSFLSTAFLLILLSLFEQRLIISFSWIFKDLVVFPVVDALFAFAAYILPFYVFGKPILKGKDYFF